MKEKEEERLTNLKKYEENLYNEGLKYICGIDEAGRGPLAGPVVVGAVVMPRDSKLEFMNDSKKVTAKRRDILYDEINTTPITPTTLNREASTRADTMYTRLVIGYNRPDKRLAVGITNYVPSGTPYLFFSMSGKIWVVDEESYEVIIDGRDFTETNIIPDTSINTTAAIENIGLFKGEKISVTVSGTCAVSADIKIVPFSQTAHCVVSV